MKIFADENVPLITVRALEASGHDVLDIRGTSDEGMDDDLLWERIRAEGRMVITTDKGFADYRDDQHEGILIVRLRQPNRQRIHERVMMAMGQVEEAEWPGLLVTLRDTVQSMWRGGRGD